MTKFEYDIEFQRKIIYSLLSDKLFLTKTYKILKIRYFDLISHQFIVLAIFGYFEKYKKNPNIENLIIFIKSEIFKELLKKEFKYSEFEKNKEDIKNELKEIYKKSKNLEWLDNLEFIKEEAITFCIKREFEKSILELADYLEKGSDIDNLMNKYREIQYKINAQIDDYEVNTLDEILDYAIENQRGEIIPTPFPIINQITNGGFARRELSVIMGLPGTGKSWFLTNIAAYLVKNNYNVLYITLELSKFYVSNRILAQLSKIPVNQIKYQKDIVKERISKYNLNNFKIVELPPKSISVDDLKLLIEQKIMEGANFDVVLIDYADLLLPPSKGLRLVEKEYQALGNIYKALIAMAKEFDFLVYTVTQSNRSGYQKDFLTEDTLSGSLKKLEDTDYIMSFKRKEKESNVINIKVLKNRFGPDQKEFIGIVDFSIGDIHIFENEAQLEEFLENNPSYLNKVNNSNNDKQPDNQGDTDNLFDEETMDDTLPF